MYWWLFVGSVWILATALAFAEPATISAVANAASYDAEALSAGEIVVIYGEDLGPPEIVGASLGADGYLATELAETRVLFQGAPAPLLYVSKNQSSCVVPYASGALRSVMITVERNGIAGPPFQARVTQSAPGLFTADASGRGQAAALNQDSSRNGPDNPAMAGSIVTVYLTGEGETDPPGIDGKPAGDPLPEPVQDVTAEIGGLPAAVHYAGGAPGFTAGLMQVNLQVPQAVQPGPNVPVRVKVGQNWSQEGVTLAVAPGPNPAGATMYPISLDFDNLRGAADFSFLNQPIGPTARVFVNGPHFFQVGDDLEPRTGDDRRLRFFGVNLSFGGNFPSAEDAPRVARRLRRMGVNLVRLHHMDTSAGADPSTAQSILTGGPYPSLNEVAAMRLRTFLDALKQEGIYANLNLHVGYEFRPGLDGVPNLPGGEMPSQSKPLHIIHWKMIELQEEYARQLIRALRLKDDPVLAMVEISNEASLVRSWRTGQLDEVLLGEYRAALEERWNAFLKVKYTSTDALRQTWGGAGDPGPELLNGAWQNEQHAPARATLTLTSTDGVPTARVEVHQAGNWINIKKVGFSVDPEKTYQAEVEVRADLPAGQSREIDWGVKENVSPWRTQVSRKIRVTSQWQKFEMILRPPFAMTGIGRFYLDVQNIAGATVYIRHESLRAAAVGLQDGESLEQANIGLVDGGRPASTTQTSDYILFLAEQDRGYLGRIRAVIRRETDSLVPITGTQVNWGGGPITFDSQREMDYNDSHFYEDHYNFPGRPWDQRDWRIRNSSFTASLDRFRDTAILREGGRPFTVSEYNQPWPNTKAAEIDPVLAANAAFQDWDGIMHYSYSHSNDYHQGLPRTFDLVFDLTKLPVIGQSAWLFRSGAVATGREPLDLPISREQRIQAARGRSVEELLGIDTDLFFRRRVRLAPSDNGAMPEEAAEPLSRPIVSDTGETTYDPDRGVYLVHSPTAAAVIGSIGADSVTAGALTVQLAESARGFATVLVTPVDGRPLAQTRRWLISIPGYTLGTRPGSEPPEPLPLVPYRGQEGWWTLEPDRPDEPSAPNRALASPIWMERVESFVTLATAAGAIRVYPLGSAGQRLAALGPGDVERTVGGFRIHLQAEGQRFSAWYEVVGE